MKLLFSIVLSLFSVLLVAQDFTYTIETNPDTTYNLLVTEELSSDRDRVLVFKNLTEAQLKSRLYSEVNDTWQQVATYEMNADLQGRRRSPILQALNSVGLNQYYADKVVELDQFFGAPSWSYRADTVNTTLTPLLREGNTTIMQTPDTTNFAVIIPFSQNYIRFRILPAGTNDVEMYSIDGNFYRGIDANGVRHVFIRRRN